ncbi:unnamed protein product [Mytilus coruscus]|uniref:DZIP3-like HEPN domain-containing protein n=1 Tax=Mytilus coruscus TaxID=42192 RepID=A0A6J8D7Z0_MYTCO|nr:unnamed protein product [Mytilus coruscus]
MNNAISVLIFVSTVSIFQNIILYAESHESYNFSCPSQAHWTFRAQVKCNSTLKYFCLYNNVEDKYVEGCNGPDWDRKGSKRIHAGDFTRGYCAQERFQPFKFWTNGSMSDCIYFKSNCSEEGQIVYKDNSKKDDSTCRCDYKKNFSFIKTPRHYCYCLPTEEDCSCYIKSCPDNFSLSAESELKRRNSSAPSVIICLCFICVAGLITVTVLSTKWFDEKIYSFKRCIGREKIVEQTTDEVYFLRMVHLLFRVACPVVRMIFNDEIQPDQLRKTLDKNRKALEKRYRKKKMVINEAQWDKLFKYDKEKPVSSDDFDIRLMIYLLIALANLEVGDLYPVHADTSICAMLSRIKYIRNEVTQSLNGKLPRHLFKQYWDDIGQAVLKLVSPYIHSIDIDEEKKQLFGRLVTLNLVKIDDNELSLFIVMSEMYPATILQQVITEYCTINRLSIEDILKKEKHNLYHKRMKTESCCTCSTIQFANVTFIKLIPEKHWEALYELEVEGNMHLCPSKISKCSENFTPKKIDTNDLSVSVPLILYIPNILKYVMSRLFKTGIDTFLMKNKHLIFHSMEKKRCCMCTQDPTEKTVISKKELNTLYMKFENESCKTGYKDCCCLYSIRKGIRYFHMEEVFWSKLFQVAGPISFINKIGQDAFQYFLNWTVNDQPLRKTLKELLKTTKNKEFRQRMLEQVSTVNISKLDKSIIEKVDANVWISRHIQDQQSTTDSALHILVRNIDVSPEENNFLVIVHGLTQIVHPIIKNEFTMHCPDKVLDKIRKEIYDHNCKDTCDDEHTSRKKKINLARIQRDQLFSPKSNMKDESKNLDLKLMIYILKRKTEEEGRKDYVEQLDVIDNIRREIVQSSNGILDERNFQDILNRISKAVLHVGGEKYMEELSSLWNIENILGQ